MVVSLIMTQLTLLTITHQPEWLHQNLTHCWKGCNTVNLLK